jgi:hypothetical protein
MILNFTPLNPISPIRMPYWKRGHQWCRFGTGHGGSDLLQPDSEVTDNGRDTERERQ